MKKENKFFRCALILLGITSILFNCSKKEQTKIQIIESSLTDDEGNTYKAVTIGSQTWMAENLKVTRYRNGDLIETTPYYQNIENEVNPIYQWAYRDGVFTDTIANVATYGRLYTWYAATDGRRICPSGWHVPSIDEWTQLSDYVGGNDIAGGILKESGLTHWMIPNKAATNDWGFSALGSGSRSPKGGNLGSLLRSGNWWSCTGDDNLHPTRGCSVNMDNLLQFLSFTYSHKNTGNSVRCVKN
jgi:uncharacterized protein (TIGR02145 family)